MTAKVAEEVPGRARGWWASGMVLRRMLRWFRVVRRG